LEALNASPLDVVELYPEFSDNEEGLKSENAAIEVLAQYLSRERANLIQFKSDTEDRLTISNQALTSFRSTAEHENLESALSDCRKLLEFVETCLLKSYLTIDSPLLTPLLRVKTLVDYDRIVDLLLKNKKHSELVEFYKARNESRKALLFLNEIRASEKTIISFLQQMNMNKELELILEFAKDVVDKSEEEGITIFTENHQIVKSR
jgi:Vam6/Vps39-like protein vacuolar protein sorting-associated protein 39